MLRLRLALAALTVCLFSCAHLTAADGYMAVVTASPGKVMEGSKLLGTVPRGTRLWVFQEKEAWLEVKLPGKEQRGWIQETAMERVRLTEAQRARLNADAEHLALYEKHREANRQREAVSDLQFVLRGEREVFGNDHPYTANSLNNLGSLFRAEGDYAEARKYYEAAFNIWHKVLGDEHPRTAGALNNLGLLSWDQGDHAAARKHYEAALKIQRKVLGDEHLDTARSLNNLGLLVYDLGDYTSARKYYAESLAVLRKVLGDEHPDTAKTLNNLGDLAASQGDYSAAHEYYGQALKIRRKVLGNEHLETADSLNSLGILIYSQGENAVARKHYEEALKIYRKVLGDEHPAATPTLNNLGILVSDQGDYAAAHKFHEEALKIRRKSLGDEHPSTAGSLNSLGDLVSEEGDFSAARKYYEQALKIRRKLLGEEHPDTANTIENIARLFQREGDFTTAARTWDQSRRIERRHTSRNLSALSRHEQAEYLKNVYIWDFHEALSLGRAAASDPAVAELSAGWLVNGKGVAEEALGAAARFELPQSASLLHSLRATRNQLAELVNKPASEERNRQLAAVRAEEDTLSRNLAAVSGRDLITDPWIELNQVRKAVPSRGILVNLIRIQPYDPKAKKELPPIYTAWLIPSKDQGEIRIVDLGDAQTIDAAVEVFQQEIAKTPAAIMQDGEQAAAAAGNRALATLAELVWKPLAESLADKEELILSPDGALWLAAWAALPIGEDKLLIEKYRLRYLTSGRELVATNDTKGVTPGPARIVANPDYDQSERDALTAYLATLYPGQSPAARPAPEKLAEFEQLALRSASPIGRVARLPATGVEAEFVAAQLKKLTGAEPRMYVERNAQEGIVKLIRNPRVLMFATHGYFLPDQHAKIDDRERRLSGEPTKKAAFDENGDVIENPLLRCGLLLAGCNERDKYTDPRLGDGVLTGMEVVNLDLRGTELVVLSACETGVGQVNNGEGVAGLRQAFQLAGAKSVVSTLWQIPDRQSAVLMNDFFTNLAAGKSRADALRDAQLAMIKSRREKYGAAHPLFWAAWTITGN